MLNLHQLTDSKAKLNKNSVNNHNSNNIARSYQKKTGVREAMLDRLLQTGKF